MYDGEFDHGGGGGGCGGPAAAAVVAAAVEAVEDNWGSCLRIHTISDPRKKKNF